MGEDSRKACEFLGVSWVLGAAPRRNLGMAGEELGHTGASQRAAGEERQRGGGHSDLRLQVILECWGATVSWRHVGMIRE